MSLNQISIPRWTLREAIEGCARRGVPAVGVWRDKLAAQPLAATAQQLRDSGVSVSSVCRGGFFSAETAAARHAQILDNRRAIDDCAAIGAPLLVLVCGPARGQTLGDARQTTADAIAALVPYAAEAGVRLGIEPLHPMYAAERSVIVTLAQANDIALQFRAAQVGVVVDAFHVWWDPRVGAEIARAGAHLCGYHVSDWLVPLPDILLGRGVMGEGVIDLARLGRAVAEAGYEGPIEVEIFNRQVWDAEPDEAMDALCAAFEDHVQADALPRKKYVKSGEQRG